jgi:hypothetical protein
LYLKDNRRIDRYRSSPSVMDTSELLIPGGPVA